MDSVTNENFTVVICSVDRPKFLGETLNQFRFLTQFPFEVILILGPGNDDFQIQELPFDVKIQRIPDRNLSLARNIGLSLSKTKWVIFLDDDAFPSSKWIEDYVEGVNKNRKSYFFSGKVLDPHHITFQYNGQISNLLGSSEEENFFGDLSSLNSKLFLRTPLGANFAVEKDIAVSIGGFNTALTWFLDETEFAIRMNAFGHSLVELDNALVEHWKSPSEIRDSAGRYVSIYQQWRSEGYVAGRYALPVFGAGATERNLLSKATISIENIHQAKKFGTFDESTCTRLLGELETGLLTGYRAGSDSINELVDFEVGQPIAKEQICPSVLSGINTSKKILFIYRSYLDENEAGIAVWFKTLTDQLRKMDYFVEILCENPEKNSFMFEYKSEDNLQIVLTPGNSNLVSSISNLYPGFVQHFASSAYKYVKKFQAFNPHSYIVVPSFEGFSNVISETSRVITTLHTTSHTIENILPTETVKSQVRQDFSHLENFSIRNSAHLLANTQATSEYTANIYNIDKSRISMIYHGLDAHIASPELVSNFSEFLYIGRLEPRKGLDLLLDVWEILASKSNDIKLTVVGQPVGNFGRSQVKRMKNKLSGNVDFLGYVSKEEKISLISRSSGVLIPSRYESFGLVALEAARQRRLSIGNSAGGLREILEMGLGLSLNFTNPHEVAAELENLVSDRTRITKLSDVAFDTYNENFTSLKMAVDFEEKYLRGSQSD